jgi:class 3 adenylate cyclase/copper chaperone CopZ
MSIRTLRIAGMTCEQCARTVEKALSALRGVKASVSYSEAVARVESPVDADTRELVRTIEAEGFGVGLVPSLETLLRLLRQLNQGDTQAAARAASHDDIRAMIDYLETMGECHRELEFIRETLDRFVSRNVASAVLEGHGAIRPEVREATILFTDLEGFTPLSEKLRPEQVIALLNEYFALAAEPIRRHGGVITQFQGDGMLASFNLPAADPEHAASAVQAARTIQDALNGRRFAGGVTLNTRIGINTGVVVGGTVGDGERLGYTVHGDEVNLAARLERLNKEYATRVLVSERTAKLAGRGFNFEKIGPVEIRGRAAPVVVYKLVTGAG